MKALLYLTKRSMINSLKEAIRRPLTLLLIVFITAYGAFILFSFAMFAAQVRINSPEGLFAVLTLATFYFVFGSYAAYADRKGVIFRRGHEQMVFTSPLSPKLVLIQGAFLNYVTSTIVWLILFVASLTIFSVPVWRALLLLVFGLVLEIVLELSTVIVMYGNEWLPDMAKKLIRYFIWAVIAGASVAIFLYFRHNGIDLASVRQLFGWPVIRMIPVVGWILSSFHLILFGASALDIVGTVLYIVWTLFMLLVARRMRCTGEYYEEAASYAESYARMRERKKRGEAVFSMNEDKRRLRRRAGRLQGKGASAVFYRQLMEYKKERFFIFDKMTLMCLIIVGIMVFSMTKGADDTGFFYMYGRYTLLGVGAYVAFILSNVSGKVNEETKRPFIFLIPDSNNRKLFFSTLMEHISSMLHGLIFIVPVGVVWKVHPVWIALDWMIFVVFRGISIYTYMMADMLIGDGLGATGKGFVRMLILSLFMGIGALCSVAGIFVGHPDFVFPILLLYSIIVLCLVFLLTSIRFRTMEQVEE